MIGLLTGIHVLIALVLILIVLLQSAKGTDVGSAFGGMGSQAAFGPRGTATFLSKATVGLAVTFMLTSVVLSIMGRETLAGGESVLDDEEPVAAENAPAPETPTPPETGSPDSQDVQIGIPGLEGVQATVTVENPGEPTDPDTPAATIETDPAPQTQSTSPPNTP
jgi:preprotein translocase subunit SecG